MPPGKPSNRGTTVVAIFCLPEIIVNCLLQRFGGGFHCHTLLLSHFTDGKGNGARNGLNIFSSGSTRPSPLSTSGEYCASVSLADISISSVMRDAPDAITPVPIPGKI